MARVIICDDEEDAVTIIEYFIKKSSLPLELAGIARNGIGAMQLIDQVKPQIVFLDINMPFANGFDVIAQKSGLKYILITAYSTFEHAQKALRLGACDILAKPIDFAQFEEAVMHALGYRLTGNDIVDSALHYIHAHYAERIELKKLADEVFCSEIHMSRTFKREMGISMIAYIHKVRIGEALKLLDAKEMSIQETAEAVGYHSLNNFYKYFREYVGCTPSAYLKKGGND